MSTPPTACVLLIRRAGFESLAAHTPNSSPTVTCGAESPAEAPHPRLGFTADSVAATVEPFRHPEVLVPDTRCNRDRVAERMQTSG